ncbi:MAG TPA: hypothetical protein VLX28_06195 [Thermoanaerobaculia bacterium]|nr:hypothetical protein [Thermoanaerobaculia bacterium]
MPSVLFVFSLALGSHAATAQDPGETRQLLAEIRKGIYAYMGTVEARTKELGRKVEVLSELTDAADAVSPIAMGQSLTQARHKAEEARVSAAREPALGEPAATVIASAEVLAQSLEQIQRNLRTAAVSGGQASLVTRRRALKSGS